MVFGDGSKSLLHAGLPVMGERGWYSLLPTDHWENTGSSKGKDNNPQDGAGGSGQLCQAGQEDQGST
jgi:hypothetical protein